MSSVKPTHAVVPASPSAEDEDLFDFPLVEFDLGDAPVQSSSPEPTPLERLSAPLPAAAATPQAARTAAFAVDPSTAPPPATKPATPITSAPATPAADVREPAPDDAVESEAPPPRLRGKLRKRLLQAGIPILVVLVLNVAGLVYLSAKSASLSAHAESLRAQIDTLARDVAHRPQPTAQRPDPSSSAEVETPLLPSTVELGSIEIARGQIAAGAQAEARKRLYRVLAQVDRLPDSVRKQVEPRASFLVAESYRTEAEALRRSKP